MPPGAFPGASPTNGGGGDFFPDFDAVDFEVDLDLRELSVVVHDTRFKGVERLKGGVEFGEKAGFIFFIVRFGEFTQGLANLFHLFRDGRGFYRGGAASFQDGKNGNEKEEEQRCPFERGFNHGGHYKGISKEASSGVYGVVVQTDRLHHFIEEFRLLTSRRVRHIKSVSWCLEITNNGHRANLPENTVARELSPVAPAMRATHHLRGLA